MNEVIAKALEIVKAQAGFRVMTGEEAASMVRALAQCVGVLCAPEAHRQEPGDGAGRILEKSITCLECGKSFKLLTRRHLLSHGLSAGEYCEKWGYAKGESLVCKELKRARSKKMKDMKLWEKRKKTPA